MDVHDRFRTESHSETSGRFNERFLLSLASCKACVVMDDELNILPVSSHIRSITKVPAKEDAEGLSEAEQDLKSLKDALSDDFPVGPLIKKCCTLDQGKAVVTFFDAILDKTLRSIVALIASRGRGKSAALGLAVAGAVAAGYSNIYVTAPSPDNLKTFFEFVCKGFDALEYKEHLEYDVVRSVNPDFKKAIVRINIFKQHRQTIQYIQPHEHEKLSQVELLVIDEAAAIPLPVVKSLLGPYLVFLSSTVSGYEGTGRSLSLKLLQQLEEQNRAPATGVEGSLSGCLFKKIELTESIRYASGDPIESWLNGLLCLDVANCLPSPSCHPLPSQCDLYYVNRDTLFSYHKDSELFLQRMMALCVSSHYKNSPNDLQLLADAPAHHLFVLLGPVDESKNQLPDILCVVQVCLEGQISEKSAIRSLRDGHSPHGDQIPWKFCEQFRDLVFPTLSGARIVRIAVHPNAMKMGYGSAAVELLTRYFEGQLASISEGDDELDVEASPLKVTEAAKKGKAVVTFFDAILDKTLRSIVALIASRGRGKSAALGLAVAGAVAAGYSNIYVTAPSPDNLKTFFEFVCKGFDALEYKEHLEYDVVRSVNPDFKKAIVRINIFKQHRQTIQYIQPHEHEKLSQVELLVIDEAAAIPLPVVKSLLGPYLVFLSSTVSGYEGTGRSLSLKLLQQLEEQSRAPATGVEGSLSGCLFKKIELTESIRYASGDPVESWLNGLLCLDVANCLPSPSCHPLPSQCDLYYVNRDTLFSYHKDSELFLQRMMALCVSSHYKNSPNDLQLLADAPAHHLFVLLGPVDESKNQLPDILCVVQVCLEGQISEKSAIRSLRDGHSPHGDQIPWKFCEQFRDLVFPTLSGARIVRIAVHPNAMKMGYGSAAVELLTRYFEGQLASISEGDDELDVEASPLKVTEAAKKRVLEPHNVSVDEDLREAAKQVEEQMRAKIELDPELLEQFAIGGKEAEALEKSKISSSGIISIETTKPEYKPKPSGFDKTAKKRGHDKYSSKSHKKRRA
ncbi:hypothetical protein F2Q70_00039914 [Brassica cretica]|uniref:RNA cytidine acetyltransferase n=1 Tax=Brassica cretica TaxID=69181 RepID=A0A8S9K624_BRACR|nr:hypothetical protein F2Q70_00039914 [Brassica cretica]